MSDRRLRMIRGSEEFGKQVIAVLDSTTIGVQVPGAAAWGQQVIAEALVDLLCRLHPRILISGCDDLTPEPSLPPQPQGGSLRERLEAIRTHGTTPLAPETPTITVVIGEGEGDIFCDGEGWQSYLGPVRSRIEVRQSQVPVGPIAAACRAAARVFGVVLAPFTESPPPLESTYWSALTCSSSDDPFLDPDLPSGFSLDAVLAGAGSVGGAAAYTFARVPALDGELDAVDPQRLVAHNPDRALLATEALAKGSAVKVKVVGEALAHLPIGVHGHQMPFEDWVAGRPREAKLPLVLCSFDSVEARRELQDCLPLEVVNAACGPDSIMVSGHRTLRGPCLYCLYIGGVLDTERVTYKLIMERTGFDELYVQRLLENHVSLNRQQLEQIEAYRGFQKASLAAHVGRTLDELYREALMYAEQPLEHEGEAVAVAAPFVTALAGALLAGEALKAGGGETYQEYRLGPSEPGRDRYDESLASSARYGYTSAFPRWPGRECLCQSVRRQRTLRERYGLEADEGAGHGAMN